MSQLFDYFVCSRSTIEEWADALAQGDEERQQALESQMRRFVSLPNVGQDVFNLLAHCAAGGEIDIVHALGQIDLVKAITPENPG